MEVMNVPDPARGRAGCLPWGDPAEAIMRGEGVDGHDVVPSGMVARVLAATEEGGTPLLDSVEAWGTAAIIDGLIEVISIEGGGAAACPDGAHAALVEVDATVRALAASAVGMLEVGIVLTSEGAMPVVHVVASPVDRVGDGRVARSIRLAPSESDAIRADAALAQIGWTKPPFGADRALPTKCLA